MFDDLVTGSVKDLEDRVAVALARSGMPTAATNGLGGTPEPAVKPAPVVEDDPRTDVDESQLECSWVGAC
jgi:D-alanyl-D-alanine carboxypeptidase/D-alanyl-D-alanine-endopeptidase (penicillin-binding protein 4)